MLCIVQSAPSKKLAQGVKSRELFESLGHKAILCHNEYMVGHMSWVLGRFSEADATYEAGLVGARTLGNRWDEALTLGGQANLRMSQGRFGEAVADAEEALTVLEGVGSPRIRLVAISLGLLPILSELQDFTNLDEALTSARTISDSLGSNYLRPRLIACQGWMNLRAGREQEARVGFETARSTFGVVLLECLWSLRFELLAWEEAGSAADVENVGRRLCEQARDESPPLPRLG